MKARSYRVIGRLMRQYIELWDFIMMDRNCALVENATVRISIALPGSML